VGFSGRSLETNNDSKYLNTGTTKIFNKSNLFFNINEVKSLHTDKLIIVEGYMDAIAFYRAGYKNVVATMGVALTNNQINLLHSLNELKTIILAFDNDDAGSKANIENGRKLMENGFNVYVIGSYDKNIKDVDELLNVKGKSAIDDIIDNYRDFLSFEIENSLNKKLSLDEKQTVINHLIKEMIELGDLSIKSINLKLMSKLSGLDFNDLNNKYSLNAQRYQKLDIYEKKPANSFLKSKNKTKIDNEIGLDDQFYEAEQYLDENQKVNFSECELLLKQYTNLAFYAKEAITRTLDYLILFLINYPQYFKQFKTDQRFKNLSNYVEQASILKVIELLLQNDQIKINEQSIIEKLVDLSNKSPNYQKAYMHFKNIVNDPYYLQFKKGSFKNKQSQVLDDILNNLYEHQYQFLLYTNMAKVFELIVKEKSNKSVLIPPLLLKIKNLKEQYQELSKLKNKNKNKHPY